MIRPGLALSAIRARRVQLELAGRRRPLRRRIPRQLEPRPVEAAYGAMLKALLRRARELVQTLLVPALPQLIQEAARDRGDALTLDAPKRVNRIAEELSEQWFKEFPGPRLERLTQQFGERTSDWNRKELGKQLEAAVGVNPLVAEPSLPARIEAFTAENVALIQTLPQRYFDGVERSVLAGIRAGDIADDILEEMGEEDAKAQRRAELIARDQVGKLYGELNQVRQEALGLEGYIWRTARDERVRPEHQEREGERFSWDDPPWDGHPGAPINCRCIASPDIDALVESL